MRLHLYIQNTLGRPFRSIWVCNNNRKPLQWDGSQWGWTYNPVSESLMNEWNQQLFDRTFWHFEYFFFPVHYYFYVNCKKIRGECEPQQADIELVNILSDFFYFACVTQQKETHWAQVSNFVVVDFVLCLYNNSGSNGRMKMSQRLIEFRV